MKYRDLDIIKTLEIDIRLGTHELFFQGSLFEIIKHYYRKLLTRSNKCYIQKDRKLDFICVRSLERSSYDHLWNSVLAQIGGGYAEFSFKWVDLSVLKSDLPIDTRAGFGQKVRVLLLIFGHLNWLLKIKTGRTLKEALQYYFRALIILTEAKKLMELKFDNLLVFADMQHLDNLLVQMCNKNGVNTITLQHGMYVDYSSQPDNVNVVNYENIVSKYFCAWGEETEGLVKKYHPQCSIEICGNPALKAEIMEREKKFVTALLDQPIFRENNQQLIEIAEEYCVQKNMVLNIRLHPIDSIEAYKINYDNVSLGGEIKDSIFALGHTSTVIYETMAMGIPVYKLDSEVPVNKINSNLVFRSLAELEQRLEDKIDFVKESKFYLGYLGDESAERYRHFFKKMKENYV